MILGITGTNGAGKGAVVDYLVKNKGFHHYAVRDYLIEEITRRSMSLDRSSMRLIANELRETNTPHFIVERLYTQALSDGVEHAVIESIRNVGEADFLQSKGIHLLAVDADQKLRYERVQKRRSVTDQVDFPTFQHHEEREMRPEGPHDMNIRGVMARAAFVIENNGTLDELHAKIEEVLSHISG